MGTDPPARKARGLHTGRLGDRVLLQGRLGDWVLLIVRLGGQVLLQGRLGGQVLLQGSLGGRVLPATTLLIISLSSVFISESLNKEFFSIALTIINNVINHSVHINMREGKNTALTKFNEIRFWKQA